MEGTDTKASLTVTKTTIEQPDVETSTHENHVKAVPIDLVQVIRPQKDSSLKKPFICVGDAETALKKFKSLKKRRIIITHNLKSNSTFNYDLSDQNCGQDSQSKQTNVRPVIIKQEDCDPEFDGAEHANPSHRTVSPLAKKNEGVPQTDSLEADVSWKRKTMEDAALFSGLVLKSTKTLKTEADDKNEQNISQLVLKSTKTPKTEAVDKNDQNISQLVLKSTQTPETEADDKTYQNIYRPHYTCIMSPPALNKTTNLQKPITYTMDDDSTLTHWLRSLMRKTGVDFEKQQLAEKEDQNISEENTEEGLIADAPPLFGTRTFPEVMENKLLCERNQWMMQADPKSLPAVIDKAIGCNLLPKAGTSPVIKSCRRSSPNTATTENYKIVTVGNYKIETVGNYKIVTVGSVSVQDNTEIGDDSEIPVTEVQRKLHTFTCRNEEVSLEVNLPSNTTDAEDGSQHCEKSEGNVDLPENPSCQQPVHSWECTVKLQRVIEMKLQFPRNLYDGWNSQTVSQVFLLDDRSGSEEIKEKCFDVHLDHCKDDQRILSYLPSISKIAKDVEFCVKVNEDDSPESPDEEIDKENIAMEILRFGLKYAVTRYKLSPSQVEDVLNSSCLMKLFFISARYKRRCFLDLDATLSFIKFLLDCQSRCGAVSLSSLQRFLIYLYERYRSSTPFNQWSCALLRRSVVFQRNIPPDSSHQHWCTLFTESLTELEHCFDVNLDCQFACEKATVLFEADQTGAHRTLSKYGYEKVEKWMYEFKICEKDLLQKSK